MKSSSLAPLVLAATLFLAPGLSADDSADPMSATDKAAGENAQRHADIMKRFDKNGDGKLDEDEKAAAKEYNRESTAGRQAKAREKFGKRAREKFDANGDGKLDDAEKAKAAEALRNDPRLVRRFDKDGDGKLNDAEAAVAREAWSKSREKRAGKSD